MTSSQDAITFRVEGMNPAPQGSKKHVGNGVMIESCKNVMPWRLLVAKSAMTKMVPFCAGWSHWQWMAWSIFYKSPNLTTAELLKETGPRRHKITLIDVDRFLREFKNSLTAQQSRMIQGPVTMSVVFLFSRPASHFRHDGTLKPSAPIHHCVKPDLSKLLRSTEDALSKVAYEDDARIVSCSGLAKRYCVGNERPGAIITIIPLL